MISQEAGTLRNTNTLWLHPRFPQIREMGTREVGGWCVYLGGNKETGETSPLSKTPLKKQMLLI